MRTTGHNEVGAGELQEQKCSRFLASLVKLHGPYRVSEATGLEFHVLSMQLLESGVRSCLLAPLHIGGNERTQKDATVGNIDAR